MHMENEDIRIDDLQIKGFKLMQKPGQFCFGTDSVLLSDLAASLAKKNAEIAEFCCGNGAVSVLMLARREDLKIVGVEVQSDVSALARENSKLNGLEEHFSVINCDLKDMPAEYNCHFDIVVVNPPYSQKGTGLSAKSENARLSREESTAEFSDIIKSANRVLKTKGRLVFIHRANRLSSIISALKENSFELKTLRSVHSKFGAPAKLVLISAVKNGGEWCDVLPPLFIYEQDGSYTEELKRIYYHEN